MPGVWFHTQGSRHRVYVGPRDDTRHTNRLPGDDTERPSWYLHLVYKRITTRLHLSQLDRSRRLRAFIGLVKMRPRRGPAQMTDSDVHREVYEAGLEVLEAEMAAASKKEAP